MKYDYEEFCLAFGQRVKQLRKDRGLSHRRMVEEFDLHLGQLVKVEGGESVTIRTVLKLCDAFDMTLQELMQDVAA